MTNPFKTISLGAALCLSLAACTQSGTTSQGSAAENETGNAAGQQKEQVESAADEARSQVKAAASAQQERIDAEAKAAKAQIEADAAQADAAAETNQLNLDQQSQRIDQAVGSAQQAVTDNRMDDSQLTQKARRQLSNHTNVTVTVQDGKATLTGSVPSDQEKTRVETGIKAIQGIGEVNNNLEVQPKP